MKILVTGGTGLVGSALKADIKVGSEFDLRITKNAHSLISIHKPSHIIHCAARVGGLGGNMNYKGEFYYDNIMINTNIIEAARLGGIKKLVCFLSTCIFPDKIDYPLTEAKIHLGEPHSSNYPYAYAKRMADIQIRAYREQYGLDYKCVIPTNIYGSNDNFSLTQGHVIPMLIHKCYLAKQNNTDFIVWGSGKPLREFIHSEDIAKLTEWILDHYNENEPIILTTSEEVEIGYVAKLIADAMDFKGKLIFDTTKPEGQFRKPSSNEKLKKYLPDFKFKSIEEGIIETVNWFVQNYDKARK
jgi:GDP-L-fucose synthase